MAYEVAYGCQSSSCDLTDLIGNLWLECAIDTPRVGKSSQRQYELIQSPNFLNSLPSFLDFLCLPVSCLHQELG